MILDEQYPVGEIAVIVSKLLRYYAPGQVYFVSVVTWRRAPILISNIDLLREAYRATSSEKCGEVLAWVTLPDHFHAVIDPGESGLDRLLQRFKMSFAARWRSKMNINRGRTWQSRFWDHIIRDQEDLNRHINYIHYNPVKHGLATSPRAWKYSTIHKTEYANGYPADWGCSEPPGLLGEYGE